MPSLASAWRLLSLSSGLRCAWKRTRTPSLTLKPRHKRSVTMGYIITLKQVYFSVAGRSLHKFMAFEARNSRAFLSAEIERHLHRPRTRKRVRFCKNTRCMIPKCIPHEKGTGYFVSAFCLPWQMPPFHMRTNRHGFTTMGKNEIIRC